MEENMKMPEDEDMQISEPENLEIEKNENMSEMEQEEISSETEEEISNETEQEEISSETDNETECEINPEPGVIEKISQLEEKIDSMNDLFTKKIMHTTHEEKIVDQMHAELQRYKDDMYSQLVRPILLDIIDIRDSIIRMSANFEAKPVEEQNIPLQTFKDYSLDIQDVLEKNNISIYEGQEGEPFSPVKQRAIKKVKTSEEELHGKIAESLSSGYDYMGKTISPEKVAVYFYEEPESMEGENK